MKATIATRAEVLEAWAKQPVQRYVAAEARAGKCCRPGYDAAASRRRLRLWALVTADPCMSIRAMSQRLGVPFTTVRMDLAALEAGGLVQLGPKGSERARVVLIPCIVTRRAP